MQKLTFHFLGLVLLGSPAFAQDSTAAASKVFWASDGLAKVLRSTTAREKGGDAIRVSGARGEIVSGQAVLRPLKTVKAARAQITDLKGRESSVIIPAGAVTLQWVRYIDITRNSQNVPDDELVAKAPNSLPDPFWEPATIPAAADQAQPIWIEVHIPSEAQAGDYEGTLTATADGERFSLPVVLHVWHFEMPSERHLSVINWWRFPGDGFEGRGDMELLRRFCTFLVEHRQTDINMSINMIAERGNDAKGYTQDTKRLETFAETAFAAGIRQIHLHSVGRRTADILNPLARVEPNQGSFRRLAALEQVIQRRGWQKRFAVSILDEPFVYYEDSYAAVVDLVHKTAPSVRCVEAVETDHLGKLDIYVPKLSHLAMWYPRFDQLHREGAELWFYICNHPYGRYPNRWLDQSLLKARVLFWINYLYNLDGYLHWGLNCYKGDPYTQEGISKGLPLGERAIVYPGRDGLVGSIRFSAQRDGVQDYEYLWVLEHQLLAIKKRVGADADWLDPRQRPLELCRRVIQSFHDYTRDPAVMLATRESIAREIEALDENPFLLVQTSPPEGTAIPAGPRHVTVRGLATPGSLVTVNGEKIQNMRPSGYFSYVYFMPDDKPLVTVTVKHDGQTRTITRTFRTTD